MEAAIDVMGGCKGASESVCSCGELRCRGRTGDAELGDRHMGYSVVIHRL